VLILVVMLSENYASGRDVTKPAEIIFDRILIFHFKPLDSDGDLSHDRSSVNVILKVTVI